MLFFILASVITHAGLNKAGSRIITFKNNLKYFQSMDSLIAYKGKDFVIMAADTFNAYSILRMKVPSRANLVVR